MLFIQNLNLIYTKETRYPNYANQRNALKFVKIRKPNPKEFYPHEINGDRIFDCEVFLHELYFNQNTDGIKQYCENFKKYGDEIFTEGYRDIIKNWRKMINNIRIFKQNENYKIMFCDDFFFSIRTKLRGHNESYTNPNSPFSYSDRLFETAFILKPDEYGRITFNNRIVEHDTGKWFYKLITYNIINCDAENFKEKMFFRKNPDYEYKNMNYLK